jgi:hypothetical protein
MCVTSPFAVLDSIAQPLNHLQAIGASAKRGMSKLQGLTTNTVRSRGAWVPGRPQEELLESQNRTILLVDLAVHRHAAPKYWKRHIVHFCYR